jgi:hypothetical protein
MIQGESFRLRQKKTGVLGRHIATTGDMDRFATGQLRIAAG